MPPVVRSERCCIKVIGVTYINRPGAFFYPSPVGIHSGLPGFIQSQVHGILILPTLLQGNQAGLHGPERRSPGAFPIMPPHETTHIPPACMSAR